MTMKKFVSLLFAATLLFSIACGKGKEASKEDEGEDDEQTTTVAAQLGNHTDAPAQQSEDKTPRMFLARPFPPTPQRSQDL